VSIFGKAVYPHMPILQVASALDKSMNCSAKFHVLALLSAEKFVTVQTHTTNITNKTATDISTPCLSTCVDNNTTSTHKNTKARFITSYSIWPANGVGLF